jgi:dihydrolipoamide dehydrogenase
VKEVIVIGGGPGGYTAALRASQLGAKVTLIEKSFLGGTCLNLGCIPTKSLLDSCYIWTKSRELYKENTESKAPWGVIFDRKQKVVQNLRKGVASLLKAGEIKVIEGTATLVGDKKVMVNERNNQILSADIVILATGSRPVLPPIEGIHSSGVLTSDEILSLQTLPKSLSIIGGGVIGIEFATIFAELGVKVHVVEATNRILPNMDKDVSAQLKKHLEKQGVLFSLNKKVDKISKKPVNQFELVLADGDCIVSDKVLVAVGREPVLGPLNVEQNGIDVNQRKVKVDCFQRTSISGIYAIGDCSTSIMLAHVAMAEGRVAAEHALGLSPNPVVYDYVPQCVYTHPEAASVGLTAEEASKRGFKINEGYFSLQANGRALIEGETTGFIKVVTDKQYGRVLGIHLLGPHATEIIAHGVLALQLETTVEELVNTIYPHPSIVEGIREAVSSITQSAIHVLS